MNAKITIIGAGWLGSALALSLAKSGADVIATKRQVIDKKTLIENHPIHYRPFQIQDIANLDLENLSVSQRAYFTELLSHRTVIFTLPPSAFKPLNSEELALSLLESTRILIDRFLLIATKLGVKRLFYTSSTSIYGNSSGIINEALPALPQTESAQICRLIEDAFIESPIPATILRLAGLIGPNRHPVYYLSGRDHIASPYQLVNLVHQTDVITAISALIARNTPIQNEIYNIVSPCHPTRICYYEAVARRLQLPLPQFADAMPELKKIIDGSLITENGDFSYQQLDLVNAPL
ncbi:NAD(P)-dependent oxidoreductase [Ignatzschineria ureiclastica]|nr:NAD(P)-dependent oxidoreductase [Ignatzschineria ureiclastica]